MIRMGINWLRARLHERKIRREWRIYNCHNTTMLGWLPPSSDYFRYVKIGKKTYGSINAIITNGPEEKLEIGNYCSIASDVLFLLGSEHPYKGISTFPFKVKSAGYLYEASSKGPITLGDDVWIGERTIVLSGTRIGQGAVVAAGSVVVKNIPPYAIAGGVPAKVIKYRFSDDVIKKMIKGIDWSRFDDTKAATNLDLLYGEITSENVDKIISRFKALIS